MTDEDRAEKIKRLLSRKINECMHDEVGLQGVLRPLVFLDNHDRPPSYWTGRVATLIELHMPELRPEIKQIKDPPVYKFKITQD